MQPDGISWALPIILVGLIGLVVGGVAGFVIAHFLAAPAASQESAPKGLSELARLWQDRRQGRLVVELDGKRLADPHQLSSGQRARLQRLVEDLAHFAGVEMRRPEPAASTPLPQPPATAPVQPLNGGLDLDALRAAAAASAVAENLPPAPSVAAAPPAAARPDGLPLPRPAASEAELKPASVDLGDAITNIFVPPSAKTKEPVTPAARSIAAQVDEIVQERLPDSALRGRVIRVHDDPKKGILVFVDDKQYEGVGEVADPQVRAFLQECVRLWEQRG